LNPENSIITFPANRVWRTYPGGKVLDILAGKTEPEDTHFPEDWIGSVTLARNPGRETIEEGISLVEAGGQKIRFDELLAIDPEYFLGTAHVQAYGPHPRLLVKLLDSAIRLHFQCHPTAAFAQTRMNEASGKAEAYHILAIREEVENPYVYIGFQRAPDKAQLKRWIEKQDLAAIESCFDRIPVKSGDTLFIPGGYPHAIGEGILMVEIMEPSDLAVRFEFEKAGYVLPESARFMGRGLDFCLDVFDFTENSLEQVREKTFFKPRQLRDYPGGGSQFHLIGEETTPCMQVRQSVITGAVDKQEDQCFIGIVTEGSVRLSTGSDSRVVKPYEKFFFPAMARDFVMETMGKEATVLECYPPRPPVA
jgi:mannose-6-phosphate isomerase